MNRAELFDPERRSRAPLVFVVCLAVLIASVLLASLTQKSFGRVAVSNVTYTNFNGLTIRAHPVTRLNLGSRMIPIEHKLGLRGRLGRYFPFVSHQPKPEVLSTAHRGLRSQ